MTAPTQKQIEAAARVAAEMSNGGNFHDPLFYSPEQQTFWRKVVTAALTAAAQVGEPTIVVSDEQTQAAVITAAAKAIYEATIERCAQVAEADMVNNRIAGQRIAAAIRKLKDEP